VLVKNLFTKFSDFRAVGSYTYVRPLLEFSTPCDGCTGVMMTFLVSTHTDPKHRGQPTMGALARSVSEYIQPNKPTERFGATIATNNQAKLGCCLYTHFSALLAVVILRRELGNSVNDRQITPTVFSRGTTLIITSDGERWRPCERI